jgi:hypothetical protein
MYVCRLSDKHASIHIHTHTHTESTTPTVYANTSNQLGGQNSPTCLPLPTV